MRVGATVCILLLLHIPFISHQIDGTQTMAEPLKLFCYICKSVEVDELTFVEIIRSARNFYESHRIRGLLMFDGQYYLHYIVGPSDSIIQAQYRLETTANAYDSEILYLDHIHDYPAIYPGWHRAFFDASDTDSYLAQLRAAKGSVLALTAAFRSFVKQSELR